MGGAGARRVGGHGGRVRTGARVRQAAAELLISGSPRETAHHYAPVNDHVEVPRPGVGTQQHPAGAGHHGPKQLRAVAHKAAHFNHELQGLGVQLRQVLDSLIRHVRHPVPAGTGTGGTARQSPGTQRA